MYPCGGGGYEEDVVVRGFMGGAELGAGWIAAGPGCALKIGS